VIVSRLIERKRDGGRIAPEEWSALARGYADGDVTDYQMAALLMAIYVRGLDPEETSALTDAMVESGGRLDLSSLPVARVDKHSTGGVGDKVSLVLAPLVASTGVAVPMMSGRGLGHTGGTLDKLESIPGFRTTLTLAEARAQIEKLGCAMFGQSEEIAPADRKMYALRSATATIESVPLIASSIMSKKLAEGLTGLVLDIKQGAGAFLPELGVQLARTMIEVGTARGCPTVALLTAMDRPLGRACGNALEMAEALSALRGEGPEDLLELTYALGAEMLVLADVAETHLDARAMLEQAISSGRAARKFEEIVAAQGGDPAVVTDAQRLPRAAITVQFASPRAGVVASIDPRAVGWIVVELGGGRTRTEDRIDPSVGVVFAAKPGDHVDRGRLLATIHAADRAAGERALEALQRAIVVGDQPPNVLPLISQRVTSAGVEKLV
jgi:pyrimidine-nucleoside phosphorylase